MKRLNALLLLVLPLNAAATPCLDSWRAELHQAVWEVKLGQWTAFCQDATPDQALAKAKAVFVERCLDGALAAIQDGSYLHDDALKLCQEGVPGRAKIPRVPDRPRPGPSRIQVDNLVFSQGMVDDIQKKIGLHLDARQLNLLYGERGGADDGVVADVQPVAPSRPALLPAKPKASGLDSHAPPAGTVTSAKRALNIKTLQDGVVGSGVSETAVRQARLVISAMLAEADPDVVQNLVDHKVQVFIIPKDKKLVDLEPFKYLKDTNTFDGRVWDGVRGLGDTRLPGGTGYAIAVSEESLLVDHRPSEGYPKNFIMVHEFGHMVHIHGIPTRPAPPPAAAGLLERVAGAWKAYSLVSDDPLDPEARARARALGRLAYNSTAKPASFAETFASYRRSSKREGKSTLGAYADTNEKEFFAELTAAYFDIGFKNGEYNDLKRLLADRPELAEMMSRVYGPARSLRGK